MFTFRIVFWLLKAILVVAVSPGMPLTHLYIAFHLTVGAGKVVPIADNSSGPLGFFLFLALLGVGAVVVFSAQTPLQNEWQKIMDDRRLKKLGGMHAR